MARILRSCLLVFLILAASLFRLPVALSYAPETTHAALSSEIVELYNLTADKPLADRAKAWIVQGSIDEDTPPRWINHFYDPIRKAAWDGRRTGWIPALLVNAVRAIGLWPRKPLTAVQWANDRKAQLEYVAYGGDRTWQRGVEELAAGNEEEAYKILGHILHLLEDMSVPDHTRNDPHVHLGRIWGETGSPYEDYAHERWNPGTIGSLEVSSGMQHAPLPYYAKPEDHLAAVAQYSNSRFFSKDTVHSPEYPGPRVAEEDDMFAYGLDEDGTLFPLARVSIKKNNGRLERAYSLADKGEEVILSGYFHRLARRAVLHGASLVRLFHEQASEAAACRRFSAALVSAAQGPSLFSLYGEFIKWKTTWNAKRRERVVVHSLPKEPEVLSEVQAPIVIPTSTSDAISTATEPAFLDGLPLGATPPGGGNGPGGFSPAPLPVVVSNQATSSLLEAMPTSTAPMPDPAFLSHVKIYPDPRPTGRHYLIDIATVSSSPLWGGQALPNEGGWRLFVFYKNQDPPRQEFLSTAGNFEPEGSPLPLRYKGCHGEVADNKVLLIPLKSEACQNGGLLSGALAFDLIEDGRLYIETEATLLAEVFSEGDFITVARYEFDHGGTGEQVFRFTEADPRHYQFAASGATEPPQAPPELRLGFDDFRSELELSWDRAADPDTLDRLLEYQIAISTSSAISSDSWRPVGREVSARIGVAFGRAYLIGVRAVDDFGNVSAATQHAWGFPDSFIPLPSQARADFPLEMDRGGQRIFMNDPAIIDAVALFIGSDGGQFCCSRSYLELRADKDGQPGELIAATDEVQIGQFEAPREAVYVFSQPVRLERDEYYWLVPSRPHDTNGSRIFGSADDTYPDGHWRNAAGKDAYFRLRRVTE